MVALIAATLIMAVMIAVCIAVARRRPPGTPLTWGEAFIAAVWVFTILLLAYGIVPNQWLTYSDTELGWRRDEFFFGKGIEFFGRGRIAFPKEVLRDIVATGIYGVALVAHAVAWLWWQRRGKKAAAAPELETSAYGRPLMRQTSGSAP
ncbi:MAG TPA: hypothetical protein VMY88_11715 [Acidimicrobiales bacterium]|nr:hypothetical protein [Acidimicrobiales bacterium]